MEIPGGRGEQPEALWNGKSGGVGAQTVNNPPWGGYGYFLELHNSFYTWLTDVICTESSFFHVLTKSCKSDAILLISCSCTTPFNYI